ncbi:tetratricopeptide repeat protein [Elizabethkingia occulta]|uniref:tetratricopeptide repeat protein n=1 Tax=Elizabethkingia occulta TaxID=1867263 RepID=UPI00099A213F|nr:hypothetical protein [Elizabethkingia occulta]
MKPKIYLLLSIIILCITFSLLIFYDHHITENYEQTFDLPLNKKSDAYLISGNDRAYIKLINDYLKIAEQKKYPEGAALCYINLAKLKIYMGHFKEAFSLLTKAEGILKKNGSLIHRAMLANQYNLLIGFISTQEQANVYGKKAVNLLEKAEDSDLKKYIEPEIYINNGDSQGQNDLALSYYKKVQKLSLDKNTDVDAYIARYYLMKNQTDSAKTYINHAFNILEKEKGSVIDSSSVLCVTGLYNFKTKNYKLAEDYFFKALQSISDKKNVTSLFVIYVYNQLADLYKITGNIYKEDYYRDLTNNSMNTFFKEATETNSLMTKKIIYDIKSADEKAKRKEWVIIFIITMVSITIGILIYKHLNSLHQKKKILKQTADDIKKNVTSKLDNELVILAKNNDASFLVKFQETYPEFIAELLKINPDMESSELYFCALLKLNFSSREIANYTFVQIASVQQRKRRLRKRLNINAESDIYQFLKEL